jgi:ATP-dependent DNA helicase
MEELFSLLNFLMPDMFDNIEAFAEALDQDTDKERTKRRIRAILGVLMLRRTKADLKLPIPPYKEVHIPVRLNENELNWYKQIL